jgi:hypothetical protein
MVFLALSQGITPLFMAQTILRVELLVVELSPAVYTGFRDLAKRF